MKHGICDLKEKVEGLVTYLKEMVKIGLFMYVFCLLLSN